MAQFNDDENLTTPKKRYSTPLYLQEMLKSDNQRKDQLSFQVRQPASKQEERFLRPREQDCWFIPGISSTHDRSISSGSDGYHETNNDVWSPYEQSGQRRRSRYWMLNVDQSPWAGMPPIEESASSEQTPTRTTLDLTEDCKPERCSSAPGRRRTHTNTHRSNQHKPHTYEGATSRQRKHHLRGYSLPTGHPILENGQLYHPQLHVKRPDSVPNVPNYSRPWTPDFVQTRERTKSCHLTTTSPKNSDNSISYECVNGVCLSTRPPSPGEGWEGLSIPEMEAQDIMSLDHWLEKDNHAEAEFPSSISHPARSPPPIGCKEDSVRAISPQPPNTGRNHTFVSRYSWTTDDSTLEPEPELLLDDGTMDTSDDESAPPPSVALSRRSDEYDSETSSRSDQARALLTEIIKGLFGSGRGCSQFHNTICYDEYNGKQRPNIFRDHCSHGRGVQLQKGVGGYWHKFSSSPYVENSSPPRSRCRYYSEEKQCRRRMGHARRKMMKFITMRPLRIVEEV